MIRKRSNGILQNDVDSTKRNEETKNNFEAHKTKEKLARKCIEILFEGKLGREIETCVREGANKKGIGYLEGQLA